MQDALREENRNAWRPFVGVLRRPPPRHDLDRLRVPVLDHQQLSQADRYDALERSAIYRVLRCGVTRSSTGLGRVPRRFDPLAAPTAPSSRCSPKVLQSLLGHSDVLVTSV